MENKKKKLDVWNIILPILGGSIVLLRVISSRNPKWEFELTVLAFVLFLVTAFLLYRLNKK